MWPGGNDSRHRRRARGDTRPKGGALQSRRSTCGTESTGQAAASRNAGGWPRRRPNARCTTNPTACPATGRRGKKCQLVNRGHMPLWTICPKLDCAGVSRPGPEKAVSGGPGDSRHNQRPALPSRRRKTTPRGRAFKRPALLSRGREGLVLGRLSAFGIGGHAKTAGVRAVAARATESAKPCTPLWRPPRARSISSCCLAWWIRRTRPRHRHPNLSPL